MAATGHGFATSGNDQSVVMFDLKTFKVLGRIPGSRRRRRDHLRQRIEPRLHVQWRRALSTVIDPRTGKLITNIPLGGKPEYGASAGDGKVYANLTDTSEVVEIDAKTATVARRWSTAPCKQPVAMAIDTAHHRLFSGCRSGVMAVSDYQAGKVVATVPIGAGVDGAGFDPASGDAFASNADGTLHRDSSGRARPVSRRADGADAAGLAQHGARSHESSPVPRLREVRAGAGGRQGPGHRCCPARSP